MNEQSDKGEDFDRDEETMAKLLRLAGTRSPISTDIESRVYERVLREWTVSSKPAEGARVYENVRREWTKAPSNVHRRRWVLPLALAASVVLAIAVVLQPAPPTPTNVPIGSVVKLVNENQAGNLPSIGHVVYPGESLTTSAGEGISLLLANAESLRLDENTTVVINAKDQFRLIHGRVYADTGDFIYRERGLVINTAMGSVTDVGTQFAVSIGDNVLDVAVREGRVDVEKDSNMLIAVAGERMQLTRDTGAVYSALEPHDAYWDWASALAPTFDIENKSLLDFLRWAARETGRELVFEDQELRMSAMRTDLHGSVSDFEPLEAIQTVLTTTNFRYRIEADRIVIER